MAEKYTQAFIRDRKEVKREEDGKTVTFVVFKGVLKYRVDNPDYTEAPDGEDTRTAAQKRKYVWRQVAKMLECRKGRGAKQTDANIQKALDEWHAEMERKAALPAQASNTVPEYVAEFVSRKKRKDGRELAVTTKDTYKFALAHINHDRLRKRLDELTIEDVQGWLFALQREGVGEHMRDKSFRLLKGALKSARKVKAIKENPCDYIENATEGRPTPEQTKVNCLDDEGLARVNTLLDGIGHEVWADCARWALLCGMRQGEICGLRWQDVDGWRTGEWNNIHVRNVIVRSSGGQQFKDSPKNGHPREIHVNKSMAELLAYRRDTMLAQCKEANVALMPTDFVFGKVGEKYGAGFFSPNYLSKVWTMFAKTNKVYGVGGHLVTFHGTRHTFATQALMAGIPVAKVAQVLGHEDPSVTERIYFDYLPGHTKETQEQMDEIMTKRQKKAEVIDLVPNGTEG